VSWSRGAKAGNDPWLANTLEWLTTSPPPVYNFGSLPRIRSERPLRDLRLAALSGEGLQPRQPRAALESGSDLEKSTAAPTH
jgi:heme/copper-type cytochrome/quinol oxidase subunit 1